MALALDNFHIIFTAVIIYALIYAMLSQTQIIKDKRVSSVIALLAAIIVSLTGVVSFSIFYGLRLFAIIAMIFFLIILLVSFVGFDFKSDIIGEGKGKYIIVGIIGLLFFLVLVKSFFALNNSELNENQNASEINTSVNVGVDTNITGINIKPEIWSSFLFLLVLGIFVIFIGRG